MIALLRYLCLVLVLGSLGPYALARPAGSVVGEALLAEASAAYAVSKDAIRKPGRMIIIDFAQPSSERRFFVVDLETNTAEAMLVAHGRGSDPDHDGFATRFSNTPDSKMTSLGRFVTGAQYVGRHGMSLRLKGLDPINDKAVDRAIVIHGAAYVAPGRDVLGRSWGCPALEPDVAERLIPEIRNGVFLYAVGPRGG